MKTNRVSIFLAIVTAMVIIVAIFALSRSPLSEAPTYDEGDYDINIEALGDTIRELRKNIAKYETEIQRIDLEKETIKRELELILRHNEEIDTELANGDWDYNIRFLTEYLSEKDTLRE